MSNKKYKIRFFEGTHNYFLGRRKLVSVTTFIGTFFDKFNAREIARKLAKFPQNKAKKRGVRYFLNEWKAAAEYGTKVHQEIEDFIKGKRNDNVDGRTSKAIGYLAGCGYTPAATELIVYDEELGLAGTIDCILEDEKGNLILVDWKTNKKITQKSYDGKKGKEPLSHLEDCNYNKYSLQLSVYRYILERQGHTVIEQRLVHLQEDSWKEYSTEYMKEEVEEMFKHGKENDK